MNKIWNQSGENPIHFVTNIYSNLDECKRGHAIGWTYFPSLNQIMLTNSGEGVENHSFISHSSSLKYYEIAVVQKYG